MELLEILYKPRYEHCATVQGKFLKWECVNEYDFVINKPCQTVFLQVMNPQNTT